MRFPICPRLVSGLLRVVLVGGIGSLMVANSYSLEMFNSLRPTQGM